MEILIEQLFLSSAWYAANCYCLKPSYFYLTCPVKKERKTLAPYTETKNKKAREKKNPPCGFTPDNHRWIFHASFVSHCLWNMNQRVFTRSWSESGCDSRTHEPKLFSPLFHYEWSTLLRSTDNTYKIEFNVHNLLVSGETQSNTTFCHASTTKTVEVLKLKFIKVMMTGVIAWD